MRFSGMPHRPKPPIMIVAPSGSRATASAALATTLFIASHSNKMTLPVHPDLEQAISFHDSIVAEGSKALVGYDTAKALANVVLLSEIPTSYDKKENRQVNAGNLLLRGVPGGGDRSLRHHGEHRLPAARGGAEAGALRFQARAAQRAGHEGTHHRAARRHQPGSLPASAPRRVHSAARGGDAPLQPRHRLVHS